MFCGFSCLFLKHRCKRRKCYCYWNASSASTRDLVEAAPTASQRSLIHKQYQFGVGDVIVHKTLGQVGVVAARLPVCFESDEWVSRNLGQAFAERLMKAPWYLVLVGRHEAIPLDFSRYGSELTPVLLGRENCVILLLVCVGTL